MPIPVTKDVGSTVKFLKKEKPGMPHRQKIAIALETARKAGADIKENPISKEIKKRSKKKK